MKELKLSNRMTRPDFQAEFLEMMLKTAGKGDMISFAGGLPNPISFPAKQLAIAADKVLNEKGIFALQYSNPEGYLPLREFIASRYQQKGIEVTAADIFITNGSQQALDILGAVLLDENDRIIMEKPSYLAALQVFHLYNPKVLSVSLQEDGADMEELKTLLQENPKFFYSVPTFQNPTGLSYSNEKRQTLASLIKETNTIFIEDNPYGELRFHGKEKIPLQPLLKEQCVMLGTFSKTVSPGMRLGWICTTNKQLYKKMLDYKQIVDLHTNIFGQMVLHQYLIENSLDEHLTKIIALYKKQAQAMMDSIAKYFPSSVQYTKPEGGMFLWVTLPKGITAITLAKEATKQGVVIAAGDPFYETERNVSTLRLNYTNCDEKTIDKGIKILADIINSRL